MSESKKKIYKPNPISGFPEWLPEVRMVEQRWLDHIRAVFESYGYCSIETPAVEELNVIAAKGEDVDKEIYVIERLQKDENDTSEARLALHFDQTVPFARYVAQHFNDLVFPFKRYQMQKVWRGERPQAGRMREFYQCDIDVINPDNLPLSFDAEMPAIMWEILSTLPGMEGENIQIRISNRKIAYGYLNALGIQAPEFINIFIRNLDKIEKIGQEQITNNILGYLVENKINIDSAEIGDALGNFLLFAAERHQSSESLFRKAAKLESIYPQLQNDQLFSTGILELKSVLDALSHLPEGAVVADLSIVRGLDYYTGTVYETVFTDNPSYGSICSGGRYDDLAGSYINKHLPGVGISIGFSRLFDYLRTQGKLPINRKCPTDVLVIPPRDETQIDEAYKVARALRKNGVNVELATARKFDKQMSYAEKKGIRYIWFPEDGEVQDRQTRNKIKASPDTWQPEKD
ncbi:MAG: histidine--tRNA ligase [Alphaproteobacteria bacterium]